MPGTVGLKVGLSSGLALMFVHATVLEMMVSRILEQVELRESSLKIPERRNSGARDSVFGSVRVWLPLPCCLDGLRSQSHAEHTSSCLGLAVSYGGRPLVQGHLIRPDTVLVVSGRRAPDRTLTCLLQWCSCQLGAAMLLRLHAMLVPCTAFWLPYCMRALRLSNALSGLFD